jgi:hypothetical protein
MTELERLMKRVLIGATLALSATVAIAQSTPGNAPAQTQQSETPQPPPATNLWPKLSLETIASLDYAGMSSSTGPDRGTGAVVWSDTTLLVDFNEDLSLDGLFQIKPRQPLSDANPNRDLFINRGLDRREGGKMKELYLRYGDWRVGKFVQDFGRGYAMLPGPFSSDFTEEAEAYEPSDMIGVEKIHVFDDETKGWRQLSLAAFMVDRTFLHESIGYNEGMIHMNDGGVGNTRYPENLMATYDVTNQPLGNWAHLSYQASVIRWGRNRGEESSEWWSTLGSDLVIPLRWSVADTLRGRYSQLHFYVEAVRRDNFEGVSGRARTFLSGSAEYMSGPWTVNAATTQRWTTDPVDPKQRDTLYSLGFGYVLPSQTLIEISAAREQVNNQTGVQKGYYAGIRITQTLTSCSKCLMRSKAY